MPSPTKVLFLEVDAGDKNLIQDWAADGTLPTFRSLLERGLVGDTLAPEGFFVGGIWPSFYTAVTPARHGIHSLLQLRPGSYEFFRCYTGENIMREPFWNFMSRAGRKVAVLDVPLSGISQEINGIQSVEWGSHDENYGFRAWPPEFEADVRERFGLHPLDISCNAIGRTPEDFAQFRDTLVQGVQTKARLTKHYLNQGGWDFFGQVFTESHCVGHQCWHLHDRAAPGHDAALARVAGDPMRDVYVAIDTAIGELIAQVGADTTVVVLAGHRMAHKCGAQFLLPDILQRLGAAALHAPVQPGWLESTLSRAWQLLPAFAKARLRTVRNTVHGAVTQSSNAPKLPPHLARIDMRNSKCFLTDNGFPVSGLRINLAGREPNGLIRPGQELDQFCAQLADDFLAIVDADSGAPMVKSVKKTADLYQGEYLDRLPDLLIEWSDQVILGSASCGNPAGSRLRIRSKKIGTIEGVNTYCRTGDHRREGLFMAIGPHIAAGRLPQPISIMDFAPSFCALLGVEFPDVDGHPIRDVVQTDSASAVAA